jgi:putative phosphoribosyl transferase
LPVSRLWAASQEEVIDVTAQLVVPTDNFSQNTMIFLNRAEAGRRLAKLLIEYRGRRDVVVLALPRGGVPVAFQVAKELGVPLDVFVVRKLGVPGSEELAFGAIASGGIRYRDSEIVEAAKISESEIESIAAKEMRELERRECAYRGRRAALEVRGQTVILVDDGIATGASMEVAIMAVRRMRPARIVVATPVAPVSACRRLNGEVDDLVCVHVPESFWAIGEFYEDFSQVSDEEVRDLLRGDARGTATDRVKPDETKESASTRESFE